MQWTERFWAKVDKTAGCWEWTGAKVRGYGQFSLPGHKRRYAHRIVFTLSGRVVPPGLELDHLCRNRACVNPDHLEPVTHQVNIRRGLGPLADNARRTHCKRGHEFTPENTYSKPLGRECLACKRLHRQGLVA